MKVAVQGYTELSQALRKTGSSSLGFGMLRRMEEGRAGKASPTSGASVK